jgi:hypothetical protein
LIRRNLLDLNVLISLADQRHDQHESARVWFRSEGRDNFGICPLTEAGFLRITTNLAYGPGPQKFKQAIAVLQSLEGVPGYQYWEIKESWVTLTAPFAARISGHQQVTDAYLLGLAIKEDGVLVTFDKAIRYMASAEFSRNVLVLE